MAFVDATSNSDIRKKRTRSPAYPYLNLEGAIGRAKQFYDKEQRNDANINVATKHWGFVEDSSNGAQTIAALISFGLMQDDGVGEKRTVRLTQDALRILLDTRPDSVEKAELLKKCAIAPKIHKQLWERWGTQLPSDAQLRHTLLFDWETPFNENSVDYFIGEYKSTISYAGVGDVDKSMQAQSGNEVIEIGDKTIEDEVTGESFNAETRRSNLPNVAVKHMQEFIVPLSAGGKAIFQWPVSLSQEDVDDLQDALKIMERKIRRSATGTDAASGI